VGRNGKDGEDDDDEAEEEVKVYDPVIDYR
jgi:hypothetical protein